MNIFEIATKKKFRYYVPTLGEVSTEDLWDLPLSSPKRADLDTAAIVIAKLLRDNDLLSFVGEKNENNTILETKLEIIKHIIAFKLNKIKEIERQKIESSNKEELRQSLRSALAAKRNESLASLSEEELTRKLSEL